MSSSALRDRAHRLAPAIAAGTSLGVSDVLAKIVLAGGVDVVSMLSFRSLVGLAFVATWFRFGRRPSATPEVRLVSMIVGIIFAGLIFCLFKAIETIDVPTAVLSYFTYPLLTGVTAALAGLEPLRWRGMLCACIAFGGLALLIDADPAGFVLAGVAYAIGAAACRTAILLITRAYLTGANADHLVFDAVINCHIHRRVVGATRLELATHSVELDLSPRAQSRHHRGNLVCLFLNSAHRCVPHRRHHAS
jgi:probable blue pigment (indigoidine) exporter